MKLNEFTIIQAAAGLHDKKFSARELIVDCLAAIRGYDENFHAYLEVFETAERHAEEADRLIEKGGVLPPLLGIPLAIKDNILIKGGRTTAGSKILANYTAPYDATVIKKLKNHGAIFLGKTNLDEFAMGVSTENSAFGPTKNPRDTSRVPGGSSGGSAAAVAAHLCLGALGSDTGGSIRQPASFCGVVGFKPTYGSVSRHGLIAMASSLDQIGPFAKTVADAELLFGAIAGPDHFDATTHPDPMQLPPIESLKHLRIGVPKEYFISGLDHRVETAIRSALEKIEKAGAIIKEISLSHSEYALAAYYIIVPSEVSANLARFDGVRYGLQEKNARTLAEVYTHSRAHGFGTEVKRRIMLGTYALSSGYYDAYYLKAQKVRRLIKQDFERAFKEVDVIASPTAPTPAFRFGEKTDDPIQMYLADIYTVAVNLAGIPGISLPAEKVLEEKALLPVGLQLVGPRWGDRQLLGIAKLAEQVIANS